MNASSSADNDDSSARASTSLQATEPHEIQSGLSPLYLLNQLRRDAQFEALPDEPSISNEQREFKFAVIVDGHRFIGAGRNKRVAKMRAAQSALEKVFGMCFDKEGTLRNRSSLIDGCLMKMNLSSAG